MFRYNKQKLAELEVQPSAVARQGQLPSALCAGAETKKYLKNFLLYLDNLKNDIFVAVTSNWSCNKPWEKI